MDKAYEQEKRLNRIVVYLIEMSLFLATMLGGLIHWSSERHKFVSQNCGTFFFPCV